MQGAQPRKIACAECGTWCALRYGMVIDLEADLRVRILVSANRIRRRLELRADALGLTLSDLTALHVLLHARGEHISPAELARRMGVSRQRASVVAQRLERLQFAQALRISGGSRFKSMQLTAEGAAAYFAITSDPDSPQAAPLTREEALSLYPLLDRLDVQARRTRRRIRGFAREGVPWLDTFAGEGVP